MGNTLLRECGWPGLDAPAEDEAALAPYLTGALGQLRNRVCGDDITKAQTAFELSRLMFISEVVSERMRELAEGTRKPSSREVEHQARRAQPPAKRRCRLFRLLSGGAPEAAR